MLPMYMSRKSNVETTVQFWRNLVRTLCDWVAPQTEFIPMGSLLCQWNSSSMEADWREARKVKSCVQTQVSPREVCDEHNGTGTQWRAEGGGGGLGVQPHPPTPKFRRPSKIVPNSTQLWKLLKIVEFRTPTPQDVRENGSKILKLLSVRNCFTLAMTK